MKAWLYKASLDRAAIGEISGGTTPLAVFDRGTGEALQFVSSLEVGRRLCDEWDVRLDQWSGRR